MKESNEDDEKNNFIKNLFHLNKASKKIKKIKINKSAKLRKKLENI